MSFRQIHEPSGKRVRYEKVVPGIGPVDSGDIMKGYETGDDEYVLLEPDEIDAIKLETKKTLELVQFVGACEIARSGSTSPITSSRPTIWPRMPTASCATPCGSPRRSGSAS